MSRVNYARTERQALVDTMRETGPDAPTLCTGWTVRDLAVHLILREGRPDAAAGIFVPALAEHTARVSRSTGKRDFDDLLRTIETGPPLYSPMKPIDRWVNLAEMFVHHEDVLRGGADPAGPWRPRPLPAGLEKALVRPLTMVGRRTLAGSPGRVTLRTPDGAELLTAGRGEPLTVTGPVGELLLFAFGRAPVELTYAGDEQLLDALRHAERGI